MLLLPLLTNILLLLLPNYANAQHDAFRLPDIPQYAAKPTVPPEYKSFFELDGHARELVDTLIGPRPGGLVPEKSYEIARPISPTNINGGPSGGGISQLEKTLEQFFTGSGGESAQQFQLPPGFNQGFSLTNGGSSVASFSENSKPEVSNPFFSILLLLIFYRLIKSMLLNIQIRNSFTVQLQICYNSP